MALASQEPSSPNPQCAADYFCKSVACESPRGTQHWGRCVKGDRPKDAETLPDEPVDVLSP